MFSQLGDKLQDIFKDLRGHGSITEVNVNDAMRQVRLALLDADVDFQVAKGFIAKVKEKALGRGSAAQRHARAADGEDLSRRADDAPRRAMRLR
jgi:signal recognition particle GTPase